MHNNILSARQLQFIRGKLITHHLYYSIVKKFFKKTESAIGATIALSVFLGLKELFNASPLP